MGERKYMSELGDFQEEDNGEDLRPYHKDILYFETNKPDRTYCITNIGEVWIEAPLEVLVVRNIDDEDWYKVRIFRSERLKKANGKRMVQVNEDIKAFWVQGALYCLEN